jgi:hypothetical protein
MDGVRFGIEVSEMKQVRWTSVALVLVVVLIALPAPAGWADTPGDPCALRTAALQVSPPAEPRPDKPRSDYEQQLTKMRADFGTLATPLRPDQTFQGLPAGGLERLNQEYQRVKQVAVKQESDLNKVKQLVGPEMTRLQEQIDAAEKQVPLPADRIDALQMRLSTLQAQLSPLEEPLANNLDRLTHYKKAFDTVAAGQQLEKDLATLDAWAAYDNVVSAFAAADTAKDAELDAVKADFAAEKASFQTQAQVLVKAERTADTLAAARGLKERTTTSLGQLKARLEKYACWPEVADFIQNTLEPVIFRLNAWKVAAPSDLPEEPPSSGWIDQSTADAFGPAAGNTEAGTPGGPRLLLQSTKLDPEKPGEGWTFDATAGTATQSLYNGAMHAEFHWTPPPQEISASGFTMTINVSSTSSKNNRLAAGMSVRSELVRDPRGSTVGVSVISENGTPASDHVTATLRPAGDAQAGSKAYITVGVDYGPSVTYTYEVTRTQ